MSFELIAAVCPRTARCARFNVANGRLFVPGQESRPLGDTNSSTAPAEESWAWRRKTYADILAEGGALFLAVADAALVGFALCEREEGGSPTWKWPHDFLSIVDLVVLSKHRRRGVGEALLRAVEDEARAREVAAVDINAAAPSEAARRFYERHGYRLDLVTYRKPLD